MFIASFLTVVFFLNRSKTTKARKQAFIILSDAFLVLSALYCCFVYNVKNSETYFGRDVVTEKQIWIGEIIDLPQEKDKFYKAKLKITSVRQNREFKNVNGEMVVFFKKPISEALIKPRNVIVLQSGFNVIDAPLNPGEFNYHDFLANKNIYYSGFFDSSNCKLLKRNEEFSLINFGIEIKQKIIRTFRNSDLSNDAANLCIALLTGYDDDIDSETINAFAHSGTLHVLSVSGLHTGILYAVLIFILGIFDKNKKFKLLQLIIIIISLWFFVLITGFSPPVLRAVIMLNLLVVGRFYFNYGSQSAINILAVSAFAILFFNPLLLFDAGFLLSYTAILGIIYFEPYVSSWIVTENYFLKKIWQLASVSISAQISTLPIVLFMFHQFPIWFVFSNLIVIPLCTIIMFIGFLVMMKLSFVTPVINLITKLIYLLIHLTDNPHWGYLEYIDFTKKDALILCFVILLLTLFLKRKSYTFGFAFLALLIFWQFGSLLEVINKKSTENINIYHLNKKSAFDIKNKTRLFYISNCTENDFNFHIKSNHTSYNYPQKYFLNIDFVQANNLSFFHYKNKLHTNLINFLKPDVLLISNETILDTLVLKNSNLKTIIADGSNSYKQIKNLKKMADKFGVPFYSTKEKGFLSIDLN